MQSITAGGIGRRAGGRQPPSQRWLIGIVLPRFLRRPARVLLKAGWRPPRYLGAKSVALFFAATLGAGVGLGGHAANVVAAVTASAGLGIEEIKISGQSRTVETDILREIAIGAFPSLLTFDIDRAKARIEALPWVAEASIQKLYPHRLNVTIRERQPFAVWQEGERLWLIDDKGHRIADAVDDRYAALPMVVGEGAGARIGEFAALLAREPSIAGRVHAGVLIGGRRWTVVLDSGIELMLPEAGPGEALLAVARLDAEAALLSRAITAVDMRDPDRVAVRLDAEGLSARTAALKARAKLGKAKT